VGEGWEGKRREGKGRGGVKMRKRRRQSLFDNVLKASLDSEQMRMSNSK
jgi:hypothetical protein